MSEPEVLSLSISGQTCRVLAWGDASAARTVILLHGYMDAAGTWDLVAPALTQSGFRALAPDLRGYGYGVRVGVGATYHFPDYILDLAELVNQVQNTELSIVGHSMGGVVATLFAGTFPERVAKLALLEGLGPPDHVAGTMTARLRAFVEQTRKASASSKRPMTFAEALSRIQMQHAGIDAEVLKTRIPHLLDKVGDDAYVWLYDMRHRARSPSPFVSANFAEYAGAVACPVLFASGGKTGWHPEDEPARLASFRNLKRVEFPEAGHMMHWTKPQVLAQQLLQFLG
jgi:pimeloyl-ACP methyl ester carboxylesterase